MNPVQVARLLRTQPLLPDERKEAMRVVLQSPVGCYSVLTRPGKAAPLTKEERRDLVDGAVRSDKVSIKLLTTNHAGVLITPQEKLAAVQALLSRHPHISPRIQRWMRLANTTTITTEVFLSQYAQR